MSKSNRLVLGIDPGVTGGLFWISEKGAPVRQAVMPVVGEMMLNGKTRNILDVLGFNNHLTTMRPDLVVVERQQPMGGGSSQQIVMRAPWHLGVAAAKSYLLNKLRGGDSPLTAFSVGGMYRALLACCTLAELKTEIVGARGGWHKIIFAGMDGKPKENALAFVQGHFPGHDFTKTARATKPHPGIVDAACIAEFGRRCLL